MSFGLKLGIEERGADTAARHLQGLAKQGDDVRPAFRQMTEELVRAEVAWFESAGAGTWPALAESTRAKKEALGQPADPLVATQKLRRSLTVKRGTGAIRSVSKTRMRFGTKVYYAVFHAGGHGVPQREPLIPTDLRTRRRMVKDIRDHVLKGTKG